MCALPRYKSLWDACINLIIYGNFWIATCAVAMSAQTYYLLEKHACQANTLGLIFCSTLLLYALHRLVGISVLKTPIQLERFSIATAFQQHIIVYAIIAALGAAWYFWQVPIQTKVALVLPALLSLAYSIPLSKNKRRLRDFPYLKIFLVAIGWAWVTVWLPAIDAQYTVSYAIGLLFAERACFIFAITIPFDIRDLEIDLQEGIKTLPTAIGIEASKKLAIIVLLFACLLSGANYYIGIYSLGTIIALNIAFLVAAVLIRYSYPTHHDYYFTGILDGTMILQAMLILSFT